MTYDTKRGLLLIFIYRGIVTAQRSKTSALKQVLLWRYIKEQLIGYNLIYKLMLFDILTINKNKLIKNSFFHR